jgi:hypothetical protein
LCSCLQISGSCVKEPAISGGEVQSGMPTADDL